MNQKKVFFCLCIQFSHAVQSKSVCLLERPGRGRGVGGGGALLSALELRPRTDGQRTQLRKAFSCGTQTYGKEGASPLCRQCCGFTSGRNSQHRLFYCLGIVKVWSSGTSGDGARGSWEQFRAGSQHGNCRPQVPWTSR